MNSGSSLGALGRGCLRVGRGHLGAGLHPSPCQPPALVVVRPRPAPLAFASTSARPESFTAAERPRAIDALLTKKPGRSPVTLRPLVKVVPSKTWTRRLRSASDSGSSSAMVWACFSRPIQTRNRSSLNRSSLSSPEAGLPFPAISFPSRVSLLRLALLFVPILWQRTGQSPLYKTPDWRLLSADYWRPLGVPAPWTEESIIEASRRTVRSAQSLRPRTTDPLSGRLTRRSVHSRRPAPTLSRTGRSLGQ